MRYIISIFAALVLMVCACNAGEFNEQDELPVLLAVKIELSSCDFARELIILQDHYRKDATVMFYQPGYEGFIEAGEKMEIINNLKALGICKELTDKFGGI